MVLRVHGGKAWIGIDAPRSIPVHRREVHEAIEQAGGRLIDPCPEDADEESDGMLVLTRRKDDSIIIAPPGFRVSRFSQSMCGMMAVAPRWASMPSAK